MKPRIYIETTIPSFYHEIRKGEDMIFMRKWTRLWWDSHRSQYDCVTSIFVLDELQSGNYPNKTQAINLLGDLDLLAVNLEIEATVGYYLKSKLMPGPPSLDAFHLAIASHYSCDYLLTWNCSHLANPRKFNHMRNINQHLNLHTPTLATPHAMIGEEADS